MAGMGCFSKGSCCTLGGLSSGLPWQRASSHANTDLATLACSEDDSSRRKVAMYAAAGGAALVVLICLILAVKLMPRPNNGTLFASPRAACSYTGASPLTR